MEIVAQDSSSIKEFTGLEGPSWVATYTWCCKRTALSIWTACEV